jgi:sec1 family domain-containing protein 1
VWLQPPVRSYRTSNSIWHSPHLSGHVPFIRAPKGNAAEMVAKRLEQKIRDAILSAARATPGTTTLFSQDATGLSNLQRPRQ